MALTVIAGGLRRYLTHHDELPERPLCAAVPISLRTGATPSTHGNNIGSMIVSLATDIADPLERLTTIRVSTANSKLRKEALGARTLLQFSDELPGRLVGVGLQAPARLG